MAPCLSFCVPSAHQLDPSLYIAISRGRSLSRLTRLFWILPNILLTIFFIAFVPQTGLAGGPHFIAGVSYFDAGAKGLPLLWAQGAVSYYTDQGDLSPLLLHAGADAF